MAKSFPILRRTPVTAWPAVHSWRVRVRTSGPSGLAHLPATLWIRYWKVIFARLAHQLRKAVLGQTFMKLTFKRREIKDLQQLGTLVAENVDGIETGLKIIGSNLNLGRASIELAALPPPHPPVLVTLGLPADDTMLLRALEAYAWCLDYPESLQKLVPATRQPEGPPRAVFVADGLPEAFVVERRLLKFSTVDFFEFRYVEANGTLGFY